MAVPRCAPPGRQGCQVSRGTARSHEMSAEVQDGSFCCWPGRRHVKWMDVPTTFLRWLWAERRDWVRCHPGLEEYLASRGVADPTPSKPVKKAPERPREGGLSAAEIGQRFSKLAEDLK